MALTLLRLEKPLFGKVKTTFERVFKTYSPERQKADLTEHLVQVHAKLREINAIIRSQQQTADIRQAEAIKVRPDEAAQA